MARKISSEATISTIITEEDAMAIALDFWRKAPDFNPGQFSEILRKEFEEGLNSFQFRAYAATFLNTGEAVKDFNAMIAFSFEDTAGERVFILATGDRVDFSSDARENMYLTNEAFSSLYYKAQRDK